MVKYEITPLGTKVLVVAEWAPNELTYTSPLSLKVDAVREIEKVINVYLVGDNIADPTIKIVEVTGNTVKIRIWSAGTELSANSSIPDKVVLVALANP